ncbi:MAG: PocR ligand-binding domain-containing protein [Solirubrobacterales bacterium]
MSNITLGDKSYGTFDLRELVDIEQLQQIQDDFASETGLAMITVDSVGSPVTEASQFSEFCQFLRRDPKIRKLCYGCDAHGGFQSSLEGKPVIYQCHAGLVDFSVSITMGNQFLGAVLAGQVLLKHGQDELQRLFAVNDAWRGDAELEQLATRIKTVDMDKLHRAADAIVTLANDALRKRSLLLTARASTGPYLGRLPIYPPRNGDSTVLAPLLDGRSKPLPLIPIESAPRLDAAEFTSNLHSRNIAGNLELLGDYLDRLLPRWSQKMPRENLHDFEDVLIGVATSEGVQYGREMTVEVMSRRGNRRSAMNRYECQLHCERLLIRLHDLVEPKLAVKDRSIATLLNEIEKDPTAFLSVAKAASYLALSESHFSRLFKQHTGQSYITFVTNKRLERAKLMLTHTDKPVLRIATELDFQPLNYFSRTFKKHVGLTPSQYRQQRSAA